MGSFRKAVKWAYVNQASDQGINAAFTFILAILLGPKDFGIVAMAMAYILLIKMILEQGLASALVQRKDLHEEHLNSVFCVNLALSVLLALLSVSLSGWWSSVNHVPVLAAVISVLSLTIPLEGLTIVQRALLYRNMDFKSLSIRSMIANMVGGVAGLIMAWRGYGVWSLVGKQLVTDFVGVIALWKLGQWRPRLRLSRKAIKELSGFSISAFIGNLGLFVNSQADALLIGLFFGPVAVGLYRLAQRITSTIVSMATSSLQAASFPQFCRLQEKPEELRKSVLACFRVAAIATVPALAIIAAVSKPLLAVCGPQWIEAATALRILCVVAAVQPILYFAGPLMQALSKPHYLAALEWAHAAVGSSVLVLAAEFLRGKAINAQVAGIAFARLFAVVILMTPMVVYLVRRLAGLRMRSVASVMTPSFVSALASISVVALVSPWATMLSPTPARVLVLEVSLAGIAAATVLFLLDQGLRDEVERMLARVFRGGPRADDSPLALVSPAGGQKAANE